MKAMQLSGHARHSPGARLVLTIACLAGLASFCAQAAETAADAAAASTTPSAAQATPAPAKPKTATEWDAQWLAQTTPATSPPAAPPAAAAEEDIPPPTEQTSTEQGQTPLDESFTHREWVRETRRKAWEDTKWDLQLRSYYLDRDKYDDTQSEAWALGGSLGFKTGYFRDTFAIGATLYTSQKLYGPDDKDGTTLLAPGQEGYTVLGELYGDIKFNDAIRLTVGAKGFDTPYINRNDSRMTPNTFLGAMLQGQHGNADDGQWRWGAGYIHEIKERNSDKFVSMAEDAGAPEGIERGVFAGGVNYKRGELSIGAVNYYSDDIINIFYTEAKYGFALSEDLKLRMAAQFTDEQSLGRELLTGSEFSAYQWGVKTELAWGGMLYTLAYTSADGDDNMRNPWSGYPGYTSVQVEDFNRDGEDAWLLRVGYAPSWSKGFSVYALHVQGDEPDAPGQFERDETDFNIQWAPSEGTLKGLSVRLRYAEVNQDDPSGALDDLRDFRLMVYYDPPQL
jgi:hypothetical protein